MHDEDSIAAQAARISAAHVAFRTPGPHRHRRMVELVDAVGPQARNPHEETYSPRFPRHAYRSLSGERGNEARSTRYAIARDRATERIDGWVLTDLAARTFGGESLRESERYQPGTGRENTARRVDALYRAHLLHATADRLLPYGRFTPEQDESRRAALHAARAQEIRAELTDNDAAARVAVLIHRAR